MPRRARVLISLALTFLLLGLFLRGVDLRGAWQEARSARPTWLLVCVAGSFLHQLLRAMRWRIQFVPTGRPVPLSTCFTCTTFGYFVSAILPGRAGDIIRPILLGARTGVSRSFALATVLVERTVLDPLTLLALLGAVLLSGGVGPALSSGSDSPMGVVWKASALLGAAILAAVIAAALLLASRRRILAWLGKRGGSGPRWSRALAVLERFAEGLVSLSQRRVWPLVALGSLLTWASVVLGMWAGVRAFGANLDCAGAVMITVLAAVGVAVPTPGGIGGFHLGVQFGLQALYGVPAERSVPAALVTHILMLLPAFTVGGWTAWKEGLDLLTVWGGTRREET